MAVKSQFIRLKRDITQGKKHEIKRILHRLETSTSASDKQKANIVRCLFDKGDRHTFVTVMAESFIHQGEERNLVEFTESTWNDIVDELYNLLPKSILTSLPETIRT